MSDNEEVTPATYQVLMNQIKNWQPRSAREVRDLAEAYALMTGKLSATTRVEIKS